MALVTAPELDRPCDIQFIKAVAVPKVRHFLPLSLRRYACHDQKRLEELRQEQTARRKKAHQQRHAFYNDAKRTDTLLTEETDWSFYLTIYENCKKQRFCMENSLQALLLLLNSSIDCFL
ncbi:hypothetical protein M514_00193 [Trichuris suis]|uniref:Uncharacterized protein n=1 Tax=Trichuris suis TaxID=68888 RepID=A0A085NUB9_9BILA|nr:hypothetical protein M513_00193 [Trichuris suis]KFD73065.1 hypothetical protein M514_00193 [Trichuris suis]